MDADKPLSFNEISDIDEELCKYCCCTEYGLNMKAKEASGASFGCEGAYCEEAYERYLEEFEDAEDPCNECPVGLGQCTNVYHGCIDPRLKEEEDE